MYNLPPAPYGMFKHSLDLYAVRDANQRILAANLTRPLACALVNLPDLLEAAETVLAAASEDPGMADGFRLHDALLGLGQAIEADKLRRKGA